VCLQINTVNNDANREITNIYQNLQIVWSQFCTEFLLFIYIWSTWNIYLFIGIRIRCQRIQTNSYTVTFSYSQYLSNIRWTIPKVEKQLFAVTYSLEVKLQRKTLNLFQFLFKEKLQKKDKLQKIGILQKNWGRVFLLVSL